MSCWKWLRKQILITQSEKYFWADLFYLMETHKCLKPFDHTCFVFCCPRHVWIPPGLFQSKTHSHHHGGRCERRERSAHLQGRKWEVEEVAFSGIKKKTSTCIFFKIHIKLLHLFWSCCCGVGVLHVYIIQLHSLVDLSRQQQPVKRQMVFVV